MDEFNVKLAPAAGNKKYNVFKLHKDDQVVWTEAKMKRENDHQPWQIKFGNGRASRRFKAIKDGGVGDNASYFIFSKSAGDTYEVCPVDEWYSVSATQRYKTLTAEEAEQKFEQRHKMFNLFSVMKKGGENDEDGPTGSSDSKNFKVSELDDWDDSFDDDRSDEDGGDDDDAKKKNRKKKNAKKEEADAPEEGKEDSDEGDYEQREVDYMSDSSSDSEISGVDRKDKDDVKGIAEEQALRDLLSSEEEEEEDAENPNRRKTGKPSYTKQELGENNSDESSDSDDFDVDEDKMDTMLERKGLPAQLSIIKQEVEHQKQQQQLQSQSQNQSQQSTSVKRRVPPEVPTANPAPKRPCVEVPVNSQEKLLEDLVRKYLSRRPMTLKSLLKDIKAKLKRTGSLSHELDGNFVNIIASVMKRLGPDKQKINDDLYYSMKN